MDAPKIEPDCFKAYFSSTETTINPPIEIYFRNWGAAASDTATGFHRSLKMQCLAIRPTDMEKILLLITADLGWWINAADEFSIRQEILAKFHLEASQVLFCLSHTHAGPSICSNDKDKKGGEWILPYLRMLRDIMSDLIKDCIERLTAGSLSWEYGKCNLATNRDLLLNEKDSYLVGYNPDVSADDTLLFGHIQSETGIPICTIVNYACHPTTLAHENSLISPDFIGEMRELISNRIQAPCLFLQGASGELAPMVQYTSDTSIADAHGRQLGFAALSIYEGMLPPGLGYRFKEPLLSGAPLAIWEFMKITGTCEAKFLQLEVEVPLKALPSLEEIKKEWEGCQDRVLKDRLWRKLNTRQVIGNGNKAPAPVWIWKLGNAFIVAQPNETYSYFQRKIRMAFPDKKIGVVNIANGYVGYMPEACYYGKDIYSRNTTPYDQGALEILTEGVIEAIRNL